MTGEVLADQVQRGGHGGDRRPRAPRLEQPDARGQPWARGRGCMGPAGSNSGARGHEGRGPAEVTESRATGVGETQENPRGGENQDRAFTDEGVTMCQTWLTVHEGEGRAPSAGSGHLEATVHPDGSWPGVWVPACGRQPPSPQPDQQDPTWNNSV